MNTGKIEGGGAESGPVSPIDSELEKAAGSKEAGENLMHIKVRTLGELKEVLIKHLGEKKGLKFYNDFIATFAMMMLSEIQHAADQAKQASEQMRSNQ